jgi:hypothetical protein
MNKKVIMTPMAILLCVVMLASLTPQAIAQSADTNQTRIPISKINYWGNLNVSNPQHLIDSGSNGYFATFNPTSASIVLQLGSTIVSPGTTMSLFVRGGSATITIYYGSSRTGPWTQTYSQTINSSGGTWIAFPLGIGANHIKIDTAGENAVYVD